MPSSNSAWKSTRHDKYYHLAKEQGYRSRAAFKLIQINKDYHFLESCKSVLDLCCAPGGWLQVCAKVMPVQSMILGVDLLPVKPIRGATILQHDITTQECEIAIKKQLKHYKLDVCLHDGAPNVSGGFNFGRDKYIQNELVLKSLQLACKFLKPNGWFVTKVFRGEDYNKLIFVFEQLFREVKFNKPKASRNESAEIFVVCKGYKAPDKIDEKMFNPKYAFQHFETGAPKNNNPFNTKLNAKQRNRSGYADDVRQIVQNRVSVLQYIDAASTEKAIDLLGTATELTFKSANADEQQLIDLYKQHKSTTDEITSLLSDLRVIGKGDFKQIVKWRSHIVAYKKSLQQTAQPDAAQIAAADDTVPADEAEVSDGEKAEAEVAELQAHMTKMEKKAAKKKKLLRNKQHKKMLINLHNANLEGDTNDVTYFSVNTLVGKEALNAVEHDDDVIDADSSEDDHTATVAADQDSDASDSGDHYYQQLESQLDNYYDMYRDQKAKSALRASKLNEREQAAEDDANDKQHMNNSSDDEIDDNIHSERSDDDDYQPLNVKFSEQVSANEQAKRWFERDVFTSIANGADNANSKMQRTSKARQLISQHASTDDDSDDGDDEVESDAESVDDRFGDAETNGNADDADQVLDANAVSKSKGHLMGLGALSTANGQANSDDEFEVVADEAVYTSDDDAVAERLAIGQNMLTKRSRDQIIDGGYNRYVFNDEGQLPEWFADNEQLHNKPMLPVTSQQVSAAKAKLIAINARPIKKIAEAKARKKVRAVRRWEKVKSQSDSIMASSELNGAQKVKQIEQMMIKQHKKKKGKHAEKQYVVSKRGGGTANSGVRAKKGARIVKVDRKMKKDKRGAKNAEKKRAAKAKGKGSKRQKV